MKLVNKISIVALAATFLFALGAHPAAKAATTVGLGAADSFAVLGGSTVTNTGSTVVTGDLGLSPGTSVTGFPPGTVVGTQHIANSTAVQAKADLVTAYDNAAGQTPATTVPTELGSTTKTPGIYSAGTLGITGTLTLDAQGDASAVFIFKAASTLITAGSSIVLLANGAQACNVFWQVGTSATLGTNSTFKGTVLALTAVTATTGANIEGRLLARNAAVTLDTNAVTRPTCAGVATPTPTPASGTSATATPAAGSGSSSSTTATATPIPGLPSTGTPPSEHLPWVTVLATMLIAASAVLGGMYRTKAHAGTK